MEDKDKSVLLQIAEEIRNMEWTKEDEEMLQMIWRELPPDEHYMSDSFEIILPTKKDE